MPRITKQNVITSPELLEQVNPDNMRLKKDFINYLRSIERSDGTIKGYDNDIDIFFVYVMKELGNKKFVQVSKRDIVSFQNWLINENGNSPARVRRIKAAISSLSNYVETVLDDEEEFSGFRSIVRKIESPVNRPVREKTVLTDKQVDKLLKKLTSRGDHQKACMLALAVCSGRRKAELVRFRVVDFDDENLVCNGALYKTKYPIRTKGFGKGKYIYCYTLAKKFKPYFDNWMEYRRLNGIESEWLFPAKDDPTKQMNYTILNGWARILGDMLDVPFYWHCLRHFFVTDLVRQGLPDSVVADIIGWSSVDMCKVYTDIDIDEHVSMYFGEDGEIKVPANSAFSQE